jgi:hypothetical protein
MKRVLSMLACAVLAVTLPQTAAAQYGKPGQDTRTAKGTVSALAPTAITVKVNDKELKLAVDEKTQVTAPGGSTASRYARSTGKDNPALTDVVKVGQDVEVQYVESTMRAASIRVVAAPPAPSAAANRPAPVAGVVTAVTDTSMTFKGKEGEWTVAVDDTTQIVATGASTKTREKREAGQKTVATDFVAAGDTVMVRYTEDGTTKRATHIRVTRKKAPSK